jgi:hypothetical protein
MTKLESLTSISICDNCKCEFTTGSVKLVVPTKNFHAPTMSAIAYNLKTDKITKSLYHFLEDGDMLLACPKCGQVHLDGFNVKQ